MDSTMAAVLPLPLVPGNVHHATPPVRVSHSRQQPLHVPQVVNPLLTRLRRDCALVVHQAQQPGDRILVTRRHDPC